MQWQGKRPGQGVGRCAPRDVAGYPHVTVPAGQAFGLPVGLSFFAGARTEAALIKFAYAFEQATKARRKPMYLATVKLP